MHFLRSATVEPASTARCRSGHLGKQCYQRLRKGLVYPERVKSETLGQSCTWIILRLSGSKCFINTITAQILRGKLTTEECLGGQSINKCANICPRPRPQLSLRNWQEPSVTGTNKRKASTARHSLKDTKTKSNPAAKTEAEEKKTVEPRPLDTNNQPHSQTRRRLCKEIRNSYSQEVTARIHLVIWLWSSVTRPLYYRKHRKYYSMCEQFTRQLPQKRVHFWKLLSEVSELCVLNVSWVNGWNVNVGV